MNKLKQNKFILIKAEQKYLRISPRKVKLVVDAIKKLPLNEMVMHLNFLNKRAAKPLAKLISQAIANAVNNKKINKDDLYLASIQVSKGPTYKRWRPVSRGRAHSIMKRTSHVKVVLKAFEKTKKINKVNKKK